MEAKNIKYIIIGVVILAVLSLIPKLFGKNVNNNVKVNQESQSVSTENSQSAPTSQATQTTSEVTTTPPAANTNPSSSSTKTTTPPPTPAPPASPNPPAPQPNPPAPAPTPAPVSVLISQFSFKGGDVTVKKGTKVTWTNQDSAPHTVTSDTSSFSSDTLSNGSAFSFTFNTVGSFSYHCAFHPSMRGTIVVTN